MQDNPYTLTMLKNPKTTSGGVTVTGNLDVTGNINSVSQIDLLVENSNITMNSGNVAQDSFIIVDRVHPQVTYIFQMGRVSRQMGIFK